ncbi:Zn-ribbon domain-containing protein [Nanoarchaeota archaeon]
MPHQCTKCKRVFEDGSATLLKGCECGSKFFFFFKKSEVKEEIKKLTAAQVDEIEEDVKEIIGPTIEDKPVILDFESVRITEPGKFEIDLVNLFKGKPVIYKVREGKYIIDIASTFQLLSGKNKKK